jgi:uncharacterized glyoxalase superfamily protein PhnB
MPQEEDVLMTPNRSAPPVSVTPVLTYANVREAVDWLTSVFGFTERVRIGDHRAQLSFGDGAVIVADDSSGRRVPQAGGGATHSVMVRVNDIDEHYAKVRAAGAVTLSAPTDMQYGERQYAATDPAGHRWTFTQSISDVAPEDWGGENVRPWLRGAADAPIPSASGASPRCEHLLYGLSRHTHLAGDVGLRVAAVNPRLSYSRRDVPIPSPRAATRCARYRSRGSVPERRRWKD